MKLSGTEKYQYQTRKKFGSTAQANIHRSQNSITFRNWKNFEAPLEQY